MCFFINSIELYSRKYTLHDCGDRTGLASLQYSDVLQESQGFRRYLRNYARDMRLTGYIQRSRGRDIQMLVEGYLAELQPFEIWLNSCKIQGMFKYCDYEDRKNIVWRDHSQFDIRNDVVKPFHREAQKDGITRGEWSDNQFELLSAHSSNLYQGGSSRDSRGSGNTKSSSRFQAAGARIFLG